LSCQRQLDNKAGSLTELADYLNLPLMQVDNMFADGQA
jgi:hypothetical protein